MRNLDLILINGSTDIEKFVWLHAFFISNAFFNSIQRLDVA